MNDLLKKCIAEAIGTAVLVFVACGVAVVAYGPSWYVSTALAFGLALIAMAYSIGNISGCHINPAVSLAKAMQKEITWKEFGWYVLSQCVGAILGALLLGICLRGQFESLGGNEIQNTLMAETALGDKSKLDAWSYIDAFLIEIALTFIFVMAVLGATDKRYHSGKFSGIIIGLALTVVHLLGLAFTGTSVNPARSLGPAVLQAIAGETTSLSQIWIWILAPFAGAALAAVCYSFLTKNKELKELTEKN